MVEVMGIHHLRLKPGLDRLILIVEIRQVSHQILYDEHMGKRIDLHSLGLFIDIAQACQGIGTIDIHGATAANSLTARSTESQGRILLVLNLDQSVQNHRSAVVQIDSVSGSVWLLVLFRVPSINFEVPDEWIK